MLEQLLLHLLFLSIKEDNFVPKRFGLSLGETITSKTLCTHRELGWQEDNN
jgi:hypothetical protein